ncbi:OB-fold domain-containing protein [Nocardia sp. NBC_00881]|uniref:OB-fold domain-containing protein n=1 Tax=Nocardia sp. NBC_00881 TaxID=2975995 RepID=UPI00386BB145|nr:OB-fold domain-containing protein [Nocardia sp. NBC_00881]
MSGLVAYGVHVPHYRLQREAIGRVLGPGGGRGTRAVASYDEDSTSMAVEASRRALAKLERSAVETLYFATASPAYADKTNATAIHAALDLPASVFAADMVGAVRSGVAAWTAAARAADGEGLSVAVLSDVRTGLPGGADERDGGDGAAAFVFGNRSDAPVLADQVGVGHASTEVLERWRLPGEASSRVWEERFGEDVYLPLAAQAFTDACKAGGVTAPEVDHLIVAGLHSRAVARIGGTLGTRPEALADSLTGVIGNAGTAQPGILLADILDRAEVGALVALVVVADGVSVFLLRTTAALAAGRPSASVAAQIASGDTDLGYATFLSWRGFLAKEPPRRPDPDHPYAPPARRRVRWKFGFVGSECQQCGQRHLPPSRICSNCHADGTMTDLPMSGTRARIATYTVDRLAATPSPPLLMVVLDFDGGGRFRCELTDASVDNVRIGGEVRMTFRRVVTSGGIHNYFWKARPVR